MAATTASAAGLLSAPAMASAAAASPPASSADDAVIMANLYNKFKESHTTVKGAIGDLTDNFVDGGSSRLDLRLDGHSGRPCLIVEGDVRNTSFNAVSFLKNIGGSSKAGAGAGKKIGRFGMGELSPSPSPSPSPAASRR